MKNILILLLFYVLITAATCQKGQVAKQWAASPPPFNLGTTQAVFYQNIAYGTDSNNRFDIFVPTQATAASLVIHIHGGGFTSGDKAQNYPQAGTQSQIKKLLDKGIAYASINYRLLDMGDTEGVKKCLNDSRRCLQFIRYHAAALKINKLKIALSGGSAGASTALYIAFHDDMKNPTATDPIEKESTRIVAVVANQSQATLDLAQWETTVFNSLITTSEIFALMNPQLINAFYGSPSPVLTANNVSSQVASYRQDVDIISFMSSDDPPFWVETKNLTLSKPTTVGHLYHHPLHAVALKNRASQFGAPLICYYDIQGVGAAKGGFASSTDFLINHL